MSDWRKALEGNPQGARAVTNMAAMCARCELMDEKAMRLSVNQTTFNAERTPSYSTLSARPESLAWVRLVIDQDKVRTANPEQTFRDTVATLDEFIIENIRSASGSSYLSYMIVNGKGKDLDQPVVYFDFRGNEAQTDALDLCTRIQSSINQGKAGGRG